VPYRKGALNIADYPSIQNDRHAIAAIGTRKKDKGPNYFLMNKGIRSFIPVSDGFVTKTEGLASSCRVAHKDNTLNTEYEGSGGDGLSPHNNKTPSEKSNNGDGLSPHNNKTPSEKSNNGDGLSPQNNKTPSEKSKNGDGLSPHEDKTPSEKSKDKDTKSAS